MSKMNVSAKKPYCKVCRDAGKPESEYTSHWVKDLSGKTTCPTLLDTECRYCHGLGHTAKFCDVLAKNNSRADYKSQATVKKSKPPSIKKPTNGFAVLECESDEEEDVPEEVPQVKKELTGWAAIAAKPKEEFKEAIATLAPGMVVLSKRSKKEPEPKAEPKPAPWAKKDVVITKKWADWSDSEDDEDDIPEYATGEVDSYCSDAWN